jgi:hypothetical protein
MPVQNVTHWMPLPDMPERGLCGLSIRPLPYPLSANIFPIRPIQSIGKDSQQKYPVSQKAFTLITSNGVNIA